MGTRSGGKVMSYCDRCGNFDESHRESMDYPKDGQHCIQDYQPELYYYWDSPIEEDYNWRDEAPEADCLCEICFDILNDEKKIKWKCASTQISELESLTDDPMCICK